MSQDSKKPAPSDKGKETFAGSGAGRVRRVDGGKQLVKDISHAKRLRVKHADLDDLQQQRAANRYEKSEEGQWLADIEKTKDIGKKTIIFLVFVTILAAATLFFVRKNRQETAGKQRMESDQSGRDAAVKREEESREESRQEFASLENGLKDFLEAKNPEKLKNYVRRREAVAPLIDEYYARNDYKPFKYLKITNFSNIIMEGKKCVLAVVDTETISKKILLTKNDDGTYLADWETFVAYRPMAWEDFLTEKPKQPLEMRVVVVPDDYYLGPFSDKEKYVSYKISADAKNEHVFGYVERNSDLHKRIHVRFADSRTRIGIFSEMILTLRWAEDGEKFKQVHIDELVADSWAHLRD